MAKFYGTQRRKSTYSFSGLNLLKKYSKGELSFKRSNTFAPNFLQIHMLEALRDIEIASEFLDSKGEGTDEEDPLDTHYMKLHCGIEPIAHDSSDFKLVERYLKQTHAPTHTVRC